MQRTYEDAFSTENSANTTAELDEVCFGALYYGAALGSKGGKPLQQIVKDRHGGSGEFITVGIQAKAGHHVLSHPENSDIASLDTQSSSKIRAIESLPSMRFEAVINSSEIKKRKKGAGTKYVINLSINVYGPSSSAEDVGTLLSNVAGYLQHPKTLPGGAKYCNPQYLVFSDDETDMENLIGVTNNSSLSQKARISDEMNSILDSLAESNSEASWDYKPPSGLLSVLKRHQEEGVRFILQRENQQIVYSLSKRVEMAAKPGHEPTNTSITSDVFYGGIVADVMGLGKTLTILAAIVCSLSDGQVFERFPIIGGNEKFPHRRAQATLVVVSSAQLLENWLSEIKTYFTPETLRVVVYHGSNRTQDMLQLTEASIILTTYATIVAEEKGANLLLEIAWYRIVLDEAHWIRNPNSKQFQSISKLKARSRWCLTGTPIQNKLDDLTSLATFLRLPPYSTRISFQTHILDPLYQGGPDFSKPLREYLKAFCVRRNETLLQLPKSTDQVVTLTLSEGEQRVYDSILQQTRRQMDNLVSQAKGIKKYNVLFMAILKMRMLCNSGTLSKSPRSAKLLSPGKQKDTGCERCTVTNEDHAILLTSYHLCPDCGRWLRSSSPYSKFVGDGISPTAEISPGRPMPEIPNIPFNGYSEKLHAVTQNIMNSEPSSKHIVFSYWTTTLDLLAEMLHGSSIGHILVDGRTSYSERTCRLQVFREEHSVSVLLMSVETGALGLNLAAANRVHIVEPQWNPSVEEQAVSRAVRMGQKREVTIFRYVMKGTVEQNIVNLQKRKKSVSKFLFDAAAEDELRGKLEDLQFVVGFDSGSGS